MKLKFFYSLKQCQPSSCMLSKCLCQIKSAHRGDEGGVINEILWCFRNRISSFSLVQMLLKTCHEILVLEVIGDCCSQQRVGSVHYQFKLLLEIFIWEGIRRICTQQNMRRDIQLLCHNFTDWVFYTGNDCFLINYDINKHQDNTTFSP